MLRALGPKGRFTSLKGYGVRAGLKTGLLPSFGKEHPQTGIRVIDFLRIKARDYVHYEPRAPKEALD